MLWVKASSSFREVVLSRLYPATKRFIPISCTIQIPFLPKPHLLSNLLCRIGLLLVAMLCCPHWYWLAAHHILPVLVCQLHNEKVSYAQKFSLGETLHCITSEWWYFAELGHLLHYARNFYKVWNHVILYLWLAKLFHFESTLKLELYFTLDNKTCLIYIRFIVHYHLMNINLRPGFVLSSFLYSFSYFFC